MTKRTCSTTECNNPIHGRGWCSKHYSQAKTQGRLGEQPRRKVLETDSLDTRLRKFGWTVTPSGCWEWNGTRSPAGYGMLQAGKGYPEVASRIAYEAWVKVPAPGNYICHTCDNPPCMNPSHLFEGTPKDNSSDMVAKKRVANGERRKYKLTDAQVSEIRAAYTEGGVTQRELAKRYNVSTNHLRDVINYKRRQHETWRFIA